MHSSPKVSISSLVTSACKNLTFFWKFADLESDRNMFSEWPLVSGIEMSSSLWLKKTLQLAPALGVKSLPPAGLKPLGEKLFIPRANFWKFFQLLGWRNFYIWHPAHSEIVYFRTSNLKLATPQLQICQNHSRKSHYWKNSFCSIYRNSLFSTPLEPCQTYNRVMMKQKSCALCLDVS